MQINVTADVRRASKKLKNYQRKQLPAATQRALNRTLRGTVTDTKKAIAARINLTQARIGKVLHKKYATKKGGPGSSGSQWVAIMSVGGERRKPNIASFKGIRKTKKGLSGKPWKTTVKYPGAFLWVRGTKGGGTATTAFHRVKDAKKVKPSKGTYAGKRVKRGPNKGKPIMRQPIKPLFGDSIVGVFLQTPKQGEPVKQVLLRTVPKRFAKEIEAQLARIRE